MYRLLKDLKCVLHSKRINSENMYIQSTMKLCSFCRVCHPNSPRATIYNNVQWRHQSIISTALLPIVKKLKRKPKKYAELLEVTDNSTNNRKAAIRKLNASHLSLLVSQRNVALDKQSIRKSGTIQLEPNEGVNVDISMGNAIQFTDSETKSVMESCSFEKTLDADKKSNLSVVEDLQSSGISDPASIIKNRSLLSSIPNDETIDDPEEDETPIKTKGSKVAKKKSKVTNQNLDAELQKINHHREQMRLESLLRTLSAYLRVCISCGMMGRAFHTIMHYRKVGYFKKQSQASNISFFNILLQAYADNKNLRKVHEVMEIIKRDSITPNVKTYATVFECFGRLSSEKKYDLQFLNSINEEMAKSAITFDNILDESKLKFDQYNSVLRGIRIIDPAFKPIETTQDDTYDCHLLNAITPNTEVCNSPAGNAISMKMLSRQFKEQMANEMKGHVEIKSIEKFDSTNAIVSYYRNEFDNLENYWRGVVTEAFTRDLKALKNREYQPIPNAMVLYPCLCVLDKEVYVNAIMHEIRKLADASESFSPSFTYLCRHLGQYINHKFELTEIKKNGYVDMTEKVYGQYCDWYVNRKKGMNSRIMWQKIVNQKSKNFKLELQPIAWPVNLQVAVGKFLYAIILKDVKLNVNCVNPDRTTERMCPAFYTVFRSTNNKHLMEEIKPHPVLSKIYRESQPETLTFETSFVPSECPPRPWSSMNTGGYLLLKTDIIRVPAYAMEQWKRLAEIPPKQLWPCLDSLNQLGSIPWTVNTAVLDLAIKVFRDGGSIKLNVPQPPSVVPPAPLLNEDSTDIERQAVRKLRMEIKRKKSEMYSLWCDALYRLSLANHFRGKVFWLPHNMDFRGRVYPVPPHLNHLGSDLARSILIFAAGKPLGPKGLDWLKIHTINLTGFKKREPTHKRLAYANEVLDKILDSAKNPLTGEMWWATSDEPWQTLACCMEISAALKCPDPEKYISQFPIHQDGSCNGLQHYAALGRDQIGAENVNLHPSDVPQDVYSSVAAMVDNLRRKDAADGHEVAQALEGFIRRKVIKQTVMTTVYGVTKFGARLQIARQLKDIDEFPQEHVWSGSMYLVQKTFESLRSMFESARQIQDWFTDCARVISKIKSRNIEWVTPLGLPVIQPYSKMQPSKSMFSDTRTDTLERPNTTKQKNAFAPNFIHSLDSCHMMLTSLHCEHAGLTFVSVHDCYWTHPCTVDIMNKICRQQFVALHSEPILKDLSKFFINTYIKDQAPNDGLIADLSDRKLCHTFLCVPKTGKFDLKGVLKSTYFFS